MEVLNLDSTSVQAHVERERVNFGSLFDVDTERRVAPSCNANLIINQGAQIICEGDETEV